MCVCVPICVCIILVTLCMDMLSNSYFNKLTRTKIFAIIRNGSKRVLDTGHLLAVIMTLCACVPLSPLLLVCLLNES